MATSTQNRVMGEALLRDGQWDNAIRQYGGREEMPKDLVRQCADMLYENGEYHDAVNAYHLAQANGKLADIIREFVHLQQRHSVVYRAAVALGDWEVLVKLGDCHLEKHREGVGVFAGVRDQLMFTYQCYSAAKEKSKIIVVGEEFEQQERFETAAEAYEQGGAVCRLIAMADGRFELAKSTFEKVSEDLAETWQRVRQLLRLAFEAYVRGQANDKAAEVANWRLANVPIITNVFYQSEVRAFTEAYESINVTPAAELLEEKLMAVIHEEAWQESFSEVAESLVSGISEIREKQNADATVLPVAG